MTKRNPKPGGNFHGGQKQKIRDTNLVRNGLQLRSDANGARMVREGKSVRGKTPPKNGAQVDHATAKSKGGTNGYDNARLITRQQNIAKSNR